MGGMGTGGGDGIEFTLIGRIFGGIEETLKEIFSPEIYCTQCGQHLSAFGGGLYSKELGGAYCPKTLNCPKPSKPCIDEATFNAGKEDKEIKVISNFLPLKQLRKLYRKGKIKDFEIEPFIKS